MKVLKILATPFIAIWRWIKETAWVQPLLIVGLIFGIIFSIPSITSWVNYFEGKTVVNEQKYQKICEELIKANNIQAKIKKEFLDEF